MILPPTLKTLGEDISAEVSDLQAVKAMYLLTVPFPPVRTAPAIFMSLSLFIYRNTTPQKLKICPMEWFDASVHGGVT